MERNNGRYKDNEKAFIYLDLPYVNSYNQSYKNYNQNNESKINNNNIVVDSTEIYIDILEYLENSKCKIIFNINSNAITRHIYKDYIKVDYSSCYSSTQIRNDNENIKINSKNKENILLISNF